MDRIIEKIRGILRGVVLGGCMIVFGLFLYRCVHGQDPVVLRAALFATFVVLAAAIARNHVGDWIDGLVALWRVLFKDNEKPGTDI